MKVRELNIRDVYPNPGQPRDAFDKESLQELADNIKAVGLLNPILVREGDGGFEIVHGERRWRAHGLAELETILCQIQDEKVDDKKSYIMSLSENLHRNDLNPIEYAMALRKVMDADGLTQTSVARRVGKSRDWVAQKLRLLALTDGAQLSVATGELSEAHAKQLIRLTNKDMVDKVDGVAGEVIEGSMTVAALKSRVDTMIVGDADREIKSYNVTLDDAILAAFTMGVRAGLARASGLTGQAINVSQDTKRETR